MPPALLLYDDTDTLLSGQTITLIPGARSAELEVRIWNDFGGSSADTAEGYSLRIEERYAGDTTWDGDGPEVAGPRRLEVRVVGGLGGLTLAAGGYQAVGAGRDVVVPTLAAGEGVRYGVSIVAPISQPALDLELALGIHEPEQLALPVGLTEATGDGVWHGLGDGTSSGLLTRGTVEPRSPADDRVTLAGVWGWIAAGTPYTLRDLDQELDDLDGDGQALAAGEAYRARLFLDADGQLDVVKGSKGVDPVDDDEAPAYPEGAEPVAQVYRDNTGVIQADDITLEARLAYAGATSSGTAVQIAPGPHLVDNRWLRPAGAEQITVPTSATSRIYRMPAGDLASTADGSRPDPRALPLWDAAADGSSVTSLSRVHRWMGRAVEISLRLGALDGTAVTVEAVPHGTLERYILPIEGEVQLILDDLGGGAATSGAVEVEIEVADPTAGPALAWTSILDAGDRPAVAFDATSTVAAPVIPDACVIGAGPRMLRARQVGAFDADHPTGATLLLRLWV